MVRFGKPTIVPLKTDRSVYFERLTWQDVLTAVGKREMDLRRLQAESELSGIPVLGRVTTILLLSRDGVQLVSTEADPGVSDLQAQVGHIVSTADFPKSPTPLRVTIPCHFEGVDAGSWNEEDIGFGSREHGGGTRGFGDPF